MFGWAIFAVFVVAVLAFAFKEPIKAWLKDHGVDLTSSDMRDTKEHLIDTIEGAAGTVRDHVSQELKERFHITEKDVQDFAVRIANELAVIARLPTGAPKAAPVSSDPAERRKEIVSEIASLQAKLRAADEAEAKLRSAVSDALK